MYVQLQTKFWFGRQSSRSEGSFRRLSITETGESTHTPHGRLLAGEEAQDTHGTAEEEGPIEPEEVPVGAAATGGVVLRENERRKCIFSNAAMHFSWSRNSAAEPTGWSSRSKPSGHWKNGFSLLMKKNIGMESSHSLQAIFSRENDTSSADSAIVHGAYRIEAGSAYE